ncbi:hypothetical protein OUZ56_025258 [Daphnia magna]|uniref:Uncharacterized protein n=1 Tax=Daphnia magna TaxID=35525 RepID=A0ABQ9ZJX7_9CRUS|nr:hypothetical protein OUZ56_025258 [Daphnia magna]
MGQEKETLKPFIHALLQGRQKEKERQEKYRKKNTKKETKHEVKKKKERHRRKDEEHLLGGDGRLVGAQLLQGFPQPPNCPAQPGHRIPFQPSLSLSKKILSDSLLVVRLTAYQ